jgi:hypothetical protein
MEDASQDLGKIAHPRLPRMSPRVHRYYLEWSATAFELKGSAGLERFYRFVHPCAVFGGCQRHNASWLRMFLLRDFRKKFWLSTYREQKVREITAAFDQLICYECWRVKRKYQDHRYRDVAVQLEKKP